MAPPAAYLCVALAVYQRHVAELLDYCTIPRVGWETFTECSI